MRQYANLCEPSFKIRFKLYPPSVPFIHSDGATAARDQQTIKHEYCRSQELELEDLKYEYTSFEAVQCLR